MRVLCSIRLKSTAPGSKAAFTLPEILVVVGVIAVLIALLLPALAGALRTSDMAKSQSRMKQIANFMTLYSGDNRETVLPTTFDYNPSVAAGYPVKVRASAAAPYQYKGTWADILWTVYKLNTLDTNAGGDYSADSPDKTVYDNIPDVENPLRSAAPNSRDLPTPPANGIPTPFGTGAYEASYPGYFAANNFFNADPTAPQYTPSMPAAPPTGRWYTNGQIKAPERSMYLVDSMAGETIDPVPGPFDAIAVNAQGVPATLEVDFRYSGNCLMMYLDGHNRPEGPWKDLPELQTQRRIKVQNLDRN